MLLSAKALLFLIVAIAASIAQNVLPVSSGQNTAFGGTRPTGIFFNRINQMMNIFSDGMINQANMLRGGVEQLTQDAANIATDVTRATIDSVALGREMIRYTIERASVPSITATIALFMSQLGNIVRSSGMDSQALPAISSQMFGFGSLQTSNGSLSSFASIIQNGPIAVDFRRFVFHVDLPFRFRDLRVDYGSYSFSTWGISLNGNITAQVRDNAFLARIQLATGCLITIKSVDVVRFEDINVNITGLCTWCSAIATFMVNSLRDVIRSQVQVLLNTAIGSLLNQNRGLFCSRINNTAIAIT